MGSNSTDFEPAGLHPDGHNNEQPIRELLLEELPYEAEWHRLWRLFRANRRMLVCVTSSAVAIVFVITFFIMTPKYQAQAIIRPINNQGPGGALSNLFGSALGAFSGSGGGSGPGLSSLFSSLGGSAGNHDPQELIAIMQSFAFTNSLIADNHLESKIIKKHGALRVWLIGAPHPSRWRLYKIMSRKFDCDYSMRTGNLSVTFVDTDPKLARFTLEQYVDRLRDQLRNEDVRDARAAVDSLKEETERSTDPLLRDALYEIIAEELRQQKIAQLDADFAFEVIEPPVTPDEPYSPWRFIDMFAAGVLSFLALVAYLYFRDRYHRSTRKINLTAREQIPATLNRAAEPKESF